MRKIIAIYDPEYSIIPQSALCVLHAGPDVMEATWTKVQNENHPHRWDDASETGVKCSVQNCSYEWLMAKVPQERSRIPREGK